MKTKNRCLPILLLLCLTCMLSLASCNLEKPNDHKNNDRSANADSNPSSEATETISPQTTQAQIAMKMYEAAIKNEIKVYETDIEEYNYLANCKTPYNRIPLADCERLKYAYTDMDNDGINELVIDCGDTLILRYYEGTVYVYSFTFRNMYGLNTDGSYSWNHTGQDFKYGSCQIFFEGSDLKARELYSIVNDGEPNAEYYVEGKKVTQKELQKYIEDHPKSKVEFSEELHLILNVEQAWNLANAYWDHQDGRTDAGAGTVVTAKIVLIDTPNPDTHYYRVAFQWEFTSNVQEGGECMPPYNVQLKDQILVNAFTGEITASTYQPGGKGCSVEEAIEIAKNYRSYMSGDICNEENGYRVEHAHNAQAPEHVYVIVIQKYDIVTDRIWIDKNTGKTISPYYLYGK